MAWRGRGRGRGRVGKGRTVSYRPPYTVWRGPPAQPAPASPAPARRRIGRVVRSPSACTPAIQPSAFGGSDSTGYSEVACTKDAGFGALGSALAVGNKCCAGRGPQGAKSEWIAVVIVFSIFTFTLGLGTVFTPWGYLLYFC